MSWTSGSLCTRRVILLGGESYYVLVYILVFALIPVRGLSSNVFYCTSGLRTYFIGFLLYYAPRVLVFEILLGKVLQDFFRSLLVLRRYAFMLSSRVHTPLLL